MKSKFSFNAYLIVIIPIVAIIFLSPIIFKNWPINFKELKAVDLLISCSIVLPFILLVFGEIRQKVTRVFIEQNSISKQSFLKKHSYNFKDFDGFYTSYINTKNGTFEYLYLVKNDKKLIKISEQYHKNYVDLKHIIEKQTRNLGEIKFRYWDEVKELFE